MPVLNGEQFIGRITEYIRAQTFGSYEALMIVSSKSTDRSLSMANAAMERDPRLRVFVYEDTGALGGSNKGITVRRTIATTFYTLEIDTIYRFLPIFKTFLSSPASPIDAEC